MEQWKADRNTIIQKNGLITHTPSKFSQTFNYWLFSSLTNMITANPHQIFPLYNLWSCPKDFFSSDFTDLKHS